MAVFPMLRPTSKTRLLAAMGLCFSILSSPAAAARAQNVASQQGLAAQALYDQATAEMDTKNYAAACPKLEEVTRLVPDGIGARLTLGDCYEKLGKLASAWSLFALLETMAARAGQPDRAKVATSRAAALRPRLATLTIEITEPARSIVSLSVVRDSVAVGSAQWGTALPVDVGSHEIVVTAPGHKAWKKNVEVVADGAKVTVSVAALELETAIASGVPIERPGLPNEPPWDRTWQRPVGLAAIATGTAGLSAGAVLGILAIAKNDQSNQAGHCDARGCDPIGIALRNEALGLGDASTVALIVGGAVLVGGVVLFATAPPRSDSKSNAALRSNLAVQLRVAPGGIHLGGQWQ